MSIYLDNAATTIKKPNEVINMVNDIVSSNIYGNPSRGAYEFSLNSLRLINDVREQVKLFLKASSNYEVVFTSSATVSLNMIIKGLLEPGDHVITTYWEHNSVLRPLYQLEETGVEIDFIGSINKNGQIDLSNLENKITTNTKAVIVNHGSNVTGHIIDLKHIKKICNRLNILLILDVAQTMGQYQINLDDEMVDAICFAGHKSLYGTTGVGGICLKKNLVEKINPIISGGDGNYSFDKQQPKVLPNLLEPGTANTLGIASLGAGLTFINTIGIEKITNHLSTLRELFVNEIKTIPNIKLYEDYTSKKSGVVSINIGDIDSSVISDILWEKYEIATRSGYHCAPLAHETLGTSEQGTVRFSFSYFNTLEEINRTIAAIKCISQGGI